MITSRPRPLEQSPLGLPLNPEESPAHGAGPFWLSLLVCPQPVLWMVGDGRTLYSFKLGTFWRLCLVLPESSFYKVDVWCLSLKMGTLVNRSETLNSIGMLECMDYSRDLALIVSLILTAN